MFEKMAAGMATIEPCPTAIVPFVREAMTQHRITADAKKIHFNFVHNDMDARVVANVDPIKVR